MCLLQAGNYGLILLYIVMEMHQTDDIKTRSNPGKIGFTPWSIAQKKSKSKYEPPEE
jgi:hypothetical protein